MQYSLRTVLHSLRPPLIAGVVLFLSVEMSTRVYLFGVAGLIPSRINSVRALTQTGFTMPSAEELIFELKPNLDGYFKLVRFVTNSHGLRDDEYPYEKPENVFRVAVVGSSYGLPSGVAIEDAFHTLLEERLSTDLAPTRFEFLNFCVGMYAPGHMITVLETRAYAYDPDLVILTATALSTPRLMDVQEPKAAKSRRKKKSYPILQSFFFRFATLKAAGGDIEPRIHIGWLERAFISLISGVRGNDFGRGDIENPGRFATQPKRSWRATPKQPGDTVLDQLARTSKAMGVPIAIVRLEFNASPKLEVDLEVAKAAAARGLFYFDTREAFQGMRAADFWIYELDRHPNAMAHEIFAESIASFLRSNDLLTPKKRR